MTVTRTRHGHPRVISVRDLDDIESVSDCSLLVNLRIQASYVHQARIDDPNEDGLASGVIDMYAPYAA